MDKRIATYPTIPPDRVDPPQGPIGSVIEESTTQAHEDKTLPIPQTPYPTRPLPGDEEPVARGRSPNQGNALQSPSVPENSLSRGEITRARVVDTLADPQHWGKSMVDIAKHIGIGDRQLRRYKTPALLREVRARYHENHVPTALLDVDKAMLSKASGKHADVPAAKLMYQRFDGMGDNQAFEQAPLEINIIARADAGTGAAGVKIRARRGT